MLMTAFSAGWINKHHMYIAHVPLVMDALRVVVTYINSREIFPVYIVLFTMYIIYLLFTNNRAEDFSSL